MVTNINSGALFTPFDLRGLSLKNRVVMSPLTRSRAGEQRLPNALMAEYYAQRSSAGLIISEATVVSKQGIGWLNSPGIYSDEQAEAWKQVVDAVHSKGTPMFLQLWHCGRASHRAFHENGELPVAPSAIKINGDYIHTPIGKQPYETPRALETDEIPAIVEDYRRAAERAKAAGFDGVELHSANGYLIDQFLQSKTNHRTDRYGGSVENRYRFLDEIVTAILTVWPSNRVGVHLAPNGNFNDMGSPDYRETFLYVARQLDRYNLAYLHVVDGLEFGFHEIGRAHDAGGIPGGVQGAAHGELRLHARNSGSCDSERTCRPDLLWTTFPQQSRPGGTFREWLAVESAGRNEGLVFV